MKGNVRFVNSNHIVIKSNQERERNEEEKDNSDRTNPKIKRKDKLEE